MLAIALVKRVKQTRVNAYPKRDKFAEAGEDERANVITLLIHVHCLDTTAVLQEQVGLLAFRTFWATV